ncbi:hypothetical protein ACJJTC_019107 [Scirpophaga incertulas]
MFVASDKDGDCVKECPTNQTSKSISEIYFEKKDIKVGISTIHGIIDKENEGVEQEIHTCYEMENTREALILENNNYVMDSVKDIGTASNLDLIKNNTEQDVTKNMKPVLHEVNKNIENKIKILSDVIVKAGDVSPILNKFGFLVNGTTAVETVPSSELSSEQTRKSPIGAMSVNLG